MSINLITGYDLNRDETGESRNTISHADWMFSQYKEQLQSNITHLPIPLDDESETEWLYTQKHKK